VKTRTTPLNETIRALYEPFVLPITAPYFQDLSGTVYNSSVDSIWTEPLGPRLCILDMDTRPLSHRNEAFSKHPIHWNNIKGVSPGIFNHYMYAMIHGYSYKFVRTNKPELLAAPWAEIPALAAILRDFDIVVSIDADAIFTHLELPYEWLLNRWNFTRDTALAMPLDPTQRLDKPASWKFHNYDSKGRLRDNPGFITAQNIPRTFEMLEEWEKCPERIPGCERFTTEYPAEMGAFSEYIRYNFEDSLREFPCTEGNGFPGMGTECEGLFVRHYTTEKEWLKGGVEEILTESIVEVLRQDLVENGKD
jgi:hypothetical protein